MHDRNARESGFILVRSFYYFFSFYFEMWVWGGKSHMTKPPENWGFTFILFYFIIIF